MKPLVSILIPAYNAEKWISYTIKSALAQTYPRKEIIVVDDGSKDRTLSVARQFASKTVSVLTQPHQGASAARNKAFAICQGDYVQWLDADDLLSPDKIARQLEIAEKCQDKRTLISCSWGDFLYRTNKARFVPTSLWEDLPPLEWILRKFEGNVHMQTATWLVSRELSDVAGPWDTRLSVDDDGEYFFRIIMASNGIKFSPEAKVLYRILGPTRLSYIGRSNEKLDSQFLSMKMQIGQLRSMHDNERVRKACVNYLQTWLVYFYPDRPDIVKRVQELAVSLGAKLQPPQLRWKYGWIEKILGWSAAKSAEQYYNGWKLAVRRMLDNALFLLEK